MSLIEWDDNLSVNVVEIDQQHKLLVRMINDLHEAMSKNNSYDETLKIIVKMTDYAVVHFQTEEKYFDQFNYPQSALHKKEHSDFVEKVKEFENDFMDGSVTLSADVINFLKEWLIKHIQGSDKKYEPFFNEHGVK